MKFLPILILISCLGIIPRAGAVEFTYWEDDAEVKNNIEYIQFYESYFLKRIDLIEYADMWRSKNLPNIKSPDLISHMGYYDIYLLKSDVYLMDVWRDKDDTDMAHLQLMFYNKDLKSGNPLNVKQIINYQIKKFEDGMYFIDNFDISTLQAVRIDSVTYYYDKGARLDRSILNYNRKVLNFITHLYDLPLQKLYYFSFKDNRSWFQFFGGDYDLAWTIAGKKEGSYTDKNAIMYSGGYSIGYSHEIPAQISIRGPRINTYINYGFSILFGKHFGQSLAWHCNLYRNDEKLKGERVLDIKIPHVSDGNFVVGGMVLAELFKRKKLDEVTEISKYYIDDNETKELINLIHDNLNSKIYNTKTLDKYLDDLVEKYTDSTLSDFTYLMRW